MTPTQAGRTLLQHARTILAQAERMREDLGAYAGGLAGQVRILSNTNALTEFLPETLSSFLAAHPHVSVDLEERLSDEIVGLIAEGVADIGIVAGTVDAGSAHDLSVPDRPLRAGGRARPSAGATHRDRLRRSARPRLRRARSRERAAALRRRQGAAASAGCSSCACSFALSTAVCRLVEKNVGVGIVPETTARWAAKAMAIKAVALTDAWAVRDLTICVRNFGALPPYARQLVDHMRADSIERAAYRPWRSRIARARAAA